MDYGKAFTFAFEDADWIKKLGIGAVLVFAGVISGGILMIPVYGWGIDITRRVINGDPVELPDWSEFGRYFGDGFKLMVISFVWALPALLIMLCAGGAAAMMAEQLGEETVGLIIGGASCLALPFYLIFLLLPAARGILADTGSLGQAINPVNAFKVFRGNIGGYLISILVIMIASMLLAIVGTIACGIGIFVTTLIQYMASGHLAGQAYRGAVTPTAFDPAMQAPV